MEKERDYRDLVAWWAAMDPVMTVYRVRGTWPETEQNGLTAEARSDATTNPAKIAAGYGALDPDASLAAERAVEQYSIARQSLRQLETRLDVAHGLGFVDGADIESLRGDTAAVRRLLEGLIEDLPEAEVEIDPFHPPFGQN